MATTSKDFEQVTRAIFQRLREQFGFERVEGVSTTQRVILASKGKWMSRPIHWMNRE